MAKTVKTGIKDQAVIVITETHEGKLYISSRNNGRSMVSKMADAIVKLSQAAIENEMKSTPSPDGGAGAAATEAARR
jgi:hypothetical protein